MTKDFLIGILFRGFMEMQFQIQDYEILTY